MTRKPNKSKSQIVAVDLFCGVGGLTHGLERGGIKVAAGIDLDESCRFPYTANNKAKFVHRDIASVTAEDLKALYGDAKMTLLAGCAPCQPFSTYSQGDKGRVGNRDWELVANFGRLVAEVQPTFVTMENVPQLASHDVFDRFLGALADYHVDWRIVECSKIGVPQTRKRLVLLASRLGANGLSFADKETSAPTVKEIIGTLPRLEAGEADPTDSLHIACKLSSTNLKRIKASKPGGTWRDWPKSLRAACHKRESGSTYPSVYGRMAWGDVAPTITTQCFGYGNGRFGHPEQNRAITLREAAMLQTFPQTYAFVGNCEKVTFSRLGRLIGNAVPVRLGEVIAETLLAHAKSAQL